MTGRSLSRLAVACQFVLLVTRTAAAQTFAVQGQLSTWFTLNDERPSTPGIGVRYVPALALEQPLKDGRLIDGEISVNAYGFGESPGWHALDTTGRLKPYRVWARFKTSRFEARAGLQKINFGSALLLRPLRWFDSVDPRDPLQITDGVYGLLLRDYLPNNFTVWAWGLSGNDRLKGLETNPTSQRTPEYGGRFEAPLFRGQAAFTTHYRRADLSRGLPYAAATDPNARENRYALDGKWDVGIGLWFEGTLTQQTAAQQVSRDTRALTIGADYTFAVGNGLHLLGEYFIQDASPAIAGLESVTRFTAASIGYPLGLLDRVSGIMYVDVERDELYRFVSWQRTYDRWQFHVMGFWNPRLLAIAQTASSTSPNAMAGKGLQIMTVFNHGTAAPTPR